MLYSFLLALLFSTLNLDSKNNFQGGYMEFYFKINHDEPNKLSFNDVHSIFTQHSWLDTSDYFTLTNKHDIRLHLTDHAIEHVTFHSHDGKYNAEGYFLDRQSDTVILCIPPFGAEIRNIIHLAGIFKEYDILLLEYQNAKTHKPLTLSPLMLKPHTISMLSNTIQQAFTWLTHRKSYTHIIAHGQCYGAWILLESQANEHNKAFFNKIILDSCPLSLHSIFKNAYNNPRGVLSLGKKESHSFTKKILHYLPFLKYFYTAFTTSFFDDISAAALISHIQVPILFITGTQDYLVTPEQFQELYTSVTHNNKSAFITPFKHLLHSLKSKELYRHYVLDFINKK